VKHLLDGVRYLLESFRKQVIEFIVNETFDAGHDQRMRSHRRTNNDPSNLADASDAFKPRGHRLRHKTSCHTGAYGHDRTLGTCS
jgi:hypothetical protein